MLEENRSLMNAFKDAHRDLEQKRAKRSNNLKTIKKRAWMVIIVLSSISLALFPAQIGHAIGHWINDFFGSMFKEMDILNVIKHK